MAAFSDVLRKRLTGTTGGINNSKDNGVIEAKNGQSPNGSGTKTPALALLMGRAANNGLSPGGMPGKGPKMSLGIGDIVMARRWVGAAAAQRRTRFSKSSS